MRDSKLLNCTRKITKHEVSRDRNNRYTDTPAPELLQHADIEMVRCKLKPTRLWSPSASKYPLEC